MLAFTSVQAGDCSTDDAKTEAVADFIEKHYPPAFMMIYSSDRDAELREVDFYPYEPQERCEGTVRVADDCRITDAEGNPLDRAASRERAFRCTP